MNSNSQDTLRRIEQNDAILSLLWIGNTGVDGGFKSSDSSDYSRLGTAIGNNYKHLRKLIVALDDEDPLDIANNEFFDGLKRNSSISNLELSCNEHILIGGVEHEILKSYQKNNNLTRLYIHHAVLDNGGCNVITDTLRWCRNLNTINLRNNNITDEQLLPMLEAIKGGCNTSLENLYLYGNRIGNAGCHALATLLEDPNSNMQTLYLAVNQIGNEGATAIADSLANNTKLKALVLGSNPFEPSAVGIFCRALCNTSSVNDTYRSNHTLNTLYLSYEQQGQHADHLASLLTMNEETNKSHVAIKKILKCHPNIDMESLFEWDTDGEQTLKALPHVVDWFERAGEAVAGDIDWEDHRVEQRQLSAIFQFAKAMPLLLEPASNIKEDDKKRKRFDM